MRRFIEAVEFTIVIISLPILIPAGIIIWAVASLDWWLRDWELKKEADRKELQRKIDNICRTCGKEL